MSKAAIGFLVLVLVVAAATLPQRAAADDIPYPCFMCFMVDPHLERVQPADCGEHWKQKLYGGRYKIRKICVKQKNGAWLVYLWACPICPKTGATARREN